MGKIPPEFDDSEVMHPPEAMNQESLTYTEVHIRFTLLLTGKECLWAGIPQSFPHLWITFLVGYPQPTVRLWITHNKSQKIR